MKKLRTRTLKRLFTFGCSFTNYKWPTWSNIVAIDLGIELQNFGLGGAGNQYIFNQIMTADNRYRFTTDDLIMVCWTNIAREDRYVRGKWITPGNIFTQGEYDSSYVKKYADIIGYGIRDFATIKATWEFLTHRGCEFHMMKMAEFEMADQWNPQDQLLIAQNLFEEYQFYLDDIADSFYKVLWNNDINLKLRRECTEIHPDYRDGHPLVLEHLQYLELTFDHKFSPHTVDYVEAKNEAVVKRIQEYCDKKIPLWDARATFVDI